MIGHEEVAEIEFAPAVTLYRYALPPHAFKRRCWGCDGLLWLGQQFTCSNACRQKLYRRRLWLRPLLERHAMALGRGETVKARIDAELRPLFGCWVCPADLLYADARTCSSACKQKLYRARKRLARPLGMIATLMQGQGPARPDAIWRILAMEIRPYRARVLAEQKAALLPGGRR